MSLLKRMLQEVSTLDACASICSGLHISLRMNRMCLPTSTDEPMQTCKVKDLASFHGLILCCCRMHGTSQIRWLHGTSLGTQQKKYVCTTGYHWQFLQLYMFIQSVQCTARTKMISNLPSPVQDRFGFPDSENSGWYLLEHMRPSSSKSVCQDVVEIIVKQSSISM